MPVRDFSAGDNTSGNTVFEVVPMDWDAAAFRVALDWNRNNVFAPAPLLIVHPALAKVSGATHFVSLDPRSRKVAKAGSLKLLPANL